MGDMPRDTSDSPPEVARWVRIENGARQDAARVTRRIDSVRTDGIGAEY